MNFLKKQWEKYKQKSHWNKFLDVFFIVFLLVILTNDGRIFIQRAILSTGLLGNIEKNIEIPISEENWNWKLFNEEGKQVFLSDFKGQKIFINAWATWCPPCNAEMPFIIELMKETPDVNYLFVTTEKPKKVKAHLNKKEWDIPTYYRSTLTTKELSFSSLPTTFIIDETGTLIHKSEGMKKWNTPAVIYLLNN
jgi:thiol-disulfide isomerase/thioredoxin